MATQAIGITEEQFDALPQAEGVHYELLDGEVIEVGRPRVRHQRISTKLLQSMGDHLRSARLGIVLPEMEFSLREGLRLVPDLAVLLTDKWRRIDYDASVVREIPDLVVEVISPSDLANHVDRKIRAYLEAGVAAVLVVYPGQQHVQCFTASEITDFGSGSDLKLSLLPGWSLQLTALFAED